jgi:uncharacterized protein
VSEIIKLLTKKNLLPTNPKYILSGLCYEVIMGSFAYGVSSDTSDLDVYAFCIPDREILFPNEYGWIHGFEENPHNFEQFQKHHISLDEKVYDVTIYNISKYFRLVANGNPNMIDSLFVPERCITYQNEIGKLVRKNRHIFLSKKCWHTFKGYAYAQLNKMRTKKPDPNSKRYKLYQKYGFDVKFAYHLVRLLNEVEQIMIEGDIDLERNREQLKAIRRGEWGTIGEFVHYFTTKEIELEKVYINSKLRHSVDYESIRQLLHICLEMYFAENTFYDNKNMVKKSLSEIEEIITKMKKYL